MFTHTQKWQKANDSTRCIGLPAKVGRQVLEEGIVQEELGEIQELRETIWESGKARDGMDRKKGIME